MNEPLTKEELYDLFINNIDEYVRVTSHNVLSELTELRKDRERFKWLKNNLRKLHKWTDNRWHVDNLTGYFDSPNAAIDAAIEEAE